MIQIRLERESHCPQVRLWGQHDGTAGEHAAPDARVPPHRGSYTLPLT